MKHVIFFLLVCFAIGANAQTYSKTYSEDFAELVRTAHGGNTGASGLTVRDYTAVNSEDRFGPSKKGYYTVRNSSTRMRSFSIFGSPPYSDFDSVSNTAVDLDVVCHIGVVEDQSPGFNKKGAYGIELSAGSADKKTVSYVLVLDGKTYSVLCARKEIWVEFKDAEELVSKTKSDFVKKGEDNVLRIQKTGKEWKFFVNDNLVHTLMDDTHLFVNDQLLSNIITSVHGEVYVKKYSYTFRKAS